VADRRPLGLGAALVVALAVPIAAAASATAPPGTGPSPICGASASSLPPDTAAGIRPEGFALTTARLTAPDGTAVELCLWVADTVEQQQRGLMEVTDLGGADGMVFVFAAPTEARFYMWQTPMPLTIGFFASDGTYAGGGAMDPCLDDLGDACPRYVADGPYTLALEAPIGALDDHLGPGATLQLIAPDATNATGPTASTAG
jgi:uncharacterized membrane protein (UPF0127 family)